MKYRMAIAVLALVNALVATYLHLWKVGKVGALACSTGGCMVAQFSRFGWFLGVDVALIGAVGYTLLLVAALVSVQPHAMDARGGTILLGLHVVPALLFTVRLKYGEWVVLHTFCPWCLISAVSIVLCTALVVLDWRRVNAAAPVPAAA